MITYDEDKSQKILDEIQNYNVQIPDNLIDLGFRQMASLSATVESYRSRVTTIQGEILPLKSKASIQLMSAKMNYENKLDVLIDTDPEVIALPSDKTKVARANKKLVDERNAVMSATIVHKQYVVLASIVQGVLDKLEKQSNTLVEICNLAKRMAPPLTPFQGQPFQHVYPPGAA